MQHVYSRSSTASQSLLRQRHILTEAGLLVRGQDVTGIQEVRSWCQARGVALRVLSGPLSNFADLAANDATTDLIVNVLIAVGQFQRDLQNELTDEGIAAAEAEGRYRGRPPALSGAPAEEARTAYLEQGASIAALARAHGVSRVAVRTALADLLPGALVPHPGPDELLCGSP